MSELPNGWDLVKLSDITIYTKGKKPDILQENFEDGFVPYIDIKAFEKGNVRQYADAKSSKLATVNDIFVVWDGARSGLVGEGINGAIGSTITAISPILINKKYLFRFLQTKYTYINTNHKGTGIPHVDPDVFWNIEVPIAPLNEQKRIVEKLEKLLKKVNACNDRLEKIPMILKRFRQSVLSAACSGKLSADWRKENNTNLIESKQIIENIKLKRLNNFKTEAQKQKIIEIFNQQEDQQGQNLPSTWGYVYLDKLCNDFQYGTSTKSEKQGKVPVLRMGNIQNGELDWDDLVYTSNDEEIEKYKLKNGDVLFNRTNSPELVGKTAIHRGERPAIFAGYLIKINNLTELDSEYLNYCLNSSYAKEYCLSVKTDGVSQSNINAQKLGKFEVPFCCIEEQKEIVKQVNKLFKLADEIEQRYNKAKSYTDKLTQSIMSKAYKGELVPQDPNDEPASVLLEKIKSEKASQVASKPSKRK